MRRIGRTILGWTLCLMMAVGMLPVAAREAKAADTAAGAGEGIVWNDEENRYEISSYAGLLEFAAIVNGTSAQVETNSAANAILTKSFSAEESAQGNTWTPIGNSSNKHYTGTFDGNGCTITGLTIKSTGDYIGLFGNIGYGGVVQNVYLEGGSVEGNTRVGGVAGHSFGTVSNCHNTGDVIGKSDFVGGVAGYNEYGTVSNCNNTGVVVGKSSVGGVAGYNGYGTVSNCYNTGAVSGSGNDVGGVVGWNPEGKVSNCYNTGDVSGSDYCVGGVVGEVLGGEASNCYNTGAVSGVDSANYVGGVVGLNNSAQTTGTVSNCYNTGAVSGVDSANYVGGVAGRNYGTVSNCFYDKFVCQKGAIIDSDDSENNVIGLATLQMIGTSSKLHDYFVQNDGGNSVWLFKTNSDGTYYYPHLAGFNFDESGKQLTADDIPAEKWPNKGTFSITLSGDRFTYNGGINGPVVDKLSLDNKAITGYKVTYLDIESNEVDPITAGEYRIRLYWENSKQFGLEKTFKILPTPATLTADSASAECDGTALTKNSYTISGLAKGDSVESVTITGSQTGPGGSDNVPSAAKIVNADGEDVTDCYDITYVNGRLTVAEHSFNQEVVDAKFLKSVATCTEAAVYYKSCACGEKGTETFASGEPLGHDYKAVEGTAGAPSCEKAGREADQKCERCGDVITGKEIPATGHTWKAATGYVPKTCEICGATEGDVIKYTVEGGNIIEFTQGDQQDITKIYHRSEDDKDSFAHYVGVQIDGKDTKIEARSGSIILAFDAKTLNSLSVGEHVVTVVFDDWKDEMKLIVKAPAEEEVKNSPPTGDSGRLILWITLLLLSVAGTSAVVMRRRQRA